MNRKPPQKPLPTSSLEILLTLAGGPQHGYGIKHEVDQRTEGAVQLGAGTLYAALQRLEDAGLIEETGDANEAQGTSRWRYFAITKVGLSRLTVELRRLQTTLETASALQLLVRSRDQ